MPYSTHFQLEVSKITAFHFSLKWIHNNSASFISQTAWRGASKLGDNYTFGGGGELGTATNMRLASFGSLQDESQDIFTSKSYNNSPFFLISRRLSPNRISPSHGLKLEPAHTKNILEGKASSKPFAKNCRAAMQNQLRCCWKSPCKLVLPFYGNKDRPQCYSG